MTFLEAVPCLPIINLSEVSTSNDTLIFDFADPSGAGNFMVEWGASGFTQGTGTTVAFDTNPDTLIGTPDGTVLDIYIQADCGGGTTNPWFGPIQVATPIVNDSTCDAVDLMFDSTYVYSNINATVQVGETRGTTGATAYNTVWFTFTAPASGAVEFDLSGTDFDAYTTVYEATDCSDFGTFTAISGYDPEFFAGVGVSLSKICKYHIFVIFQTFEVLILSFSFYSIFLDFQIGFYKLIYMMLLKILRRVLINSFNS